ncbi:MAG: hotdog fold thioesterase [Candidatus Hydrogenedens sp.]|nr:hotdog fold thioesterase [Candidatus Hydrogenedens sp.]
MLKMNAEDLIAFLRSHFPSVDKSGLAVEQVDEHSITMRLPYHEDHLRPGGTISGPSQMMLCDTAMYLMTLAQIGPVALAVTTNLNINFLRKPKPADMIAQGKMLKLGSRLAVGEVTLFSEGDDRPVAHATLTYSIPPEKERG